MLIAKSNLLLGCGRERVDAWTLASELATPEFAELEAVLVLVLVVVLLLAILNKASDASDPSKSTWGLTARYFPFPQPMSNPTEPGVRDRRNSATRGHGLCLVREKCGAMAV